jgi:hypothetical protein
MPMSIFLLLGFPQMESLQGRTDFHNLRSRSVVKVSFASNGIWHLYWGLLMERPTLAVPGYHVQTNDSAREIG